MAPLPHSSGCEREGVQGGATQRGLQVRAASERDSLTRASGGPGGANAVVSPRATGCVSGGIHSRRERGGSRGCDVAPPLLNEAATQHGLQVRAASERDSLTRASGGSRGARLSAAYRYGLPASVIHSRERAAGQGGPTQLLAREQRAA